jgi:hypothetical protein
MGTTAHTPELDPRYSSPDAPPTAWEEAMERMIRADVYWISTVRTDGRPHVTPLIALWADGAMHVSTGRLEQKARNLAANPRCVLTTGVNTQEDGVDVVLEGTAERVTGRSRLGALADLWVGKYGEDWRFDVTDDEGFRHPGDPSGVAHVFAIRPDRAFAFRKGEVFSQTRYRFSG